MTTFAHMVVRDEADRYLQAVLTAVKPHVDVIHVHDDQSTDTTIALASAAGAVCTARAPDETSFAADEGEFRQMAWEAFQTACKPTVGDWVLALDADEILVGGDRLDTAIAAAEAVSAIAVRLHIPEVFRLDDDGEAFIRTDGFWQGLAAPRLFTYLPDGLIRQDTMACGSCPTYVAEGLVLTNTDALGVELAHLGYANPADRLEKFQRYYNRSGHSMAHVASILIPPTLEPYRHLDAWRGTR